MLVLAGGGVLIYPLTQLFLRLMKRPASLPKGHTMNALGMQVAFAFTLNFPLVFAATVYHRNWFYPTFMIAIGAHYLPFVFMYWMWQFAVLAGVLVGSGVLVGLYLPGVFSLAGWVTAAMLLMFALVAVASRFRRQN